MVVKIPQMKNKTWSGLNISIKNFLKKVSSKTKNFLKKLFTSPARENQKPTFCFLIKLF